MENMNTVNWGLWLALAMLYSVLTYNPLYQLLLFAAIISSVVWLRQPILSYLKVALLVSIIPLLVNVFFIHLGDTVLVEIPRHLTIYGHRIPVIIFGGNITLESSLTGIIMTLLLVNMFSAFQLFNTMTSPDSMFRIIPSTFRNLSLAISIALRFIPSVIRDHSSIRDAQASRGVRFNSASKTTRIRNHMSTLIPTIVTSLERSFKLSESMVSRGYTGKRTRYSNEAWTSLERAISTAFMSGFIISIYAKMSGAMDYWPYDSLHLPLLSPIAVLPLMPLLMPLFEDESRRTE
ncbi:MAG: hypothetical protein GF416_08600 [Candidatus Altiarchaeales archaeon]|nr:hypothetical protein [Candidatus Altiarchaeales archaeon]MBD3417175.1 hypothetical protein [Candidatus Altiarchaeales archaeon]